MRGGIGFECEGCQKYFEVYELSWRVRWPTYLRWRWHEFWCRRSIMRFLKKLFGIGYEQFAPIVVAAARAALSAGGSALIGGVLTWLGVVDWNAYLSENQVPYALIVAGGLRFVLEGALDQLREGR